MRSRLESGSSGTRRRKELDINKFKSRVSTSHRNPRNGMKTAKNIGLQGGIKSNGFFAEGAI